MTTASLAPGRVARAVRALAALVALLLVVVGTTVGLWRFVGWPLPRRMPTLEQVMAGLSQPGLPDELLINILAVVCWLAWAQFTASLLAEVIAVLRDRPARRLPLANPAQALAGWLVGSLLMTVAPLNPRTPTGGLVAPNAGAVGLLAGQPPPAVAPLRPGPVADGEARPASARQVARPDHPVYVVKRYDTLWGIAERCLGDGRHWSRIYDLNRGDRQPDGERLTDPDFIYPGWRLRLPPEAKLPTTTAPAQPPPSPAPRLGEPADPPSGAGVPSSTATSPGTVAPPGTAAAPPTSAPTSTPAPDHGVPDGSPDDGTVQAPGGVSIQLPSGSVVSAAFAAGMLSALALVRVRDRRGRQPQPPEPGIRDHDPGVPDALRWLMRLSKPGAEPAERDSSPGADRAATNPPPAADLEGAVGHGPLIGERDGQPLHLDLAALGVVSLLGAGANDHTRAIVATMLATAGPEAAEVHLLTDRLLNDLPPFPGLHRPTGIGQALRRLEAELVRRTRLLDQAGAGDLAAYRRRADLEPLPDTLLVTDRDSAAQHLDRLLALAEHGRRLGVAALVLAPDPIPGTAVIEVEAGGAFATAAPATLRQAIDGARLHTLAEPDAAALLGTLARARASDPEPFPENSQRTSPAQDPAAYGPAADRLEETPVRAFDPPPPTRPAPRRLTVRLLGVFRIMAGDHELGRGLRKKAREMLAFYALHPEGAPLEVAAEALWPEADPTRSPQRFWTTLSNLRAIARDALGYTETEQFDLIARVGDRYRLDPNTVDVDLWHLQAALGDAARARQAGDATAELAALTRATGAYTGPLLAGTYYEWRLDSQRDVEAEREDLRRRATDALTRLAELHQAGGDHAAAAALERAIDLDPAAEELYRRLMRLQRQLGRPDAVRRTYQRLEAALTDLGVEPESATEKTFHRQ